MLRVESKWQRWKVNDSVKWFEYVLSRNYEENTNDVVDDNSDSEDENENDDNEDEKQSILETKNGNYSKQSNVTAIEIDYKVIASQLSSIGFRAKTYLPLIQQPLQFRHYGFKNKGHRKILFKYTKQLIQKYPRQSNKKQSSKS